MCIVVALHDLSNMASYSVYCIVILTTCIFISWSESADTRVEVTSPVHPTTVGGIVAIQCQVWNMQNAYTVNFFRVINGHSDQVTSVR